MRKTIRLIRPMLCLVLCLITIFSAALPALAAPRTLPNLQLAVAVYHRASAGSMVIGYMEAETELTVLGSAGDFYKIDCYDMTGYIPRSCVRTEEDRHYVYALADADHVKAFNSQDVGYTFALRCQLYSTAVAQEGVRYRLGGTSPRGFDCSGFTQYVYAQSDISLPRTCEMQIGAGIIIPKEDLKCGDLVLFTRTNHPTALVTHVGLYLGDGKLIHAGSGGITIVELEHRYFAEHYLCARRIVLSDELPLQQLMGAAISAIPGHNGNSAVTTVN